MNIEELKLLISAETSKFNNEIKKVKQEINSIANNTKSTSAKVQQEVGKMQKSFKGVLGLGGKLLAGLGLAKLGAEAINLASDIDEVQNVVDTAFGSMTPLVEQFASKAIHQFGMSALTAKRTASTYMAMSKGMGYVGLEAAKMSIEVAKLSGDLASFYNISQSITDTALKSIWTGETETLKKFGVVMTETNLKYFAMRNGMNANINAMSQQEKLLLRYKFVMESLSLAQGDFARTSDSWANQTRILSEQFKELLSILGSGWSKLKNTTIKKT